HQGSEMLPTSTRLGKSADHRLLLQSGFHLQPAVAAAAREVFARTVLGDHAFEACFLHGIEEGQALLFNVVTERQARDRGKDLPKNLLAAEQGRAAQVVPVKVENVEDLVDQMAGCAVAPIVLERLKTWMASVIQDHDFPIQD